MGLFGSIGSMIGKGIGAIGNVVKRAGEIGSSIASRVRDNAGMISQGIGNIVGGKVGNTIKGIGGTVSNIANTVSNVGKSVAGVGMSMMGKNNNSRPPPDIAGQLG